MDHEMKDLFWSYIVGFGGVLVVVLSLVTACFALEGCVKSSSQNEESVSGALETAAVVEDGAFEYPGPYSIGSKELSAKLVSWKADWTDGMLSVTWEVSNAGKSPAEIPYILNPMQGNIIVEMDGAASHKRDQMVDPGETVEVTDTYTIPAHGDISVGVFDPDTLEDLTVETLADPTEPAK